MQRYVKLRAVQRWALRSTACAPPASLPSPRDFVRRRFHSPRSAARGSGGRAPPASSALLGDGAGPRSAAATQSSSGLRRRRSAPRLACRCLVWWPAIATCRRWHSSSESHRPRRRVCSTPPVALPFWESSVISRLRLRRSRTRSSSWRRRVENSVRYHRDLERRDEIARGRRHLRRAAPHVPATTIRCSSLSAISECTRATPCWPRSPSARRPAPTTQRRAARTTSRCLLSQSRSCSADTLDLCNWRSEIHSPTVHFRGRVSRISSNRF